MAKKHEQTDDYGYKKTDEQLNELEDRLSSLYAEASHDMEKKLGDFLSGYEERDKQKRELLEAGKITEEEYQRWRVGQIFQTKKMQAQIDSLTQDLVNTDKLAMQMVNGELPSIYATNYNFQGFKAETVTDLEGVDMASFSIYNADAVARLAKKNPDLLPAPKVDIPKDMKWNKTKINTAISQGIIQGEPINKIAARLQQVTDMDYNAAIRNARTAVVGAQNAGRKDASERITKNGIPMVDVWSSTYDGRTRDTHIALNGQERDEDGYFHTFNGDKLEYPCDPKANPAEVYNCRCRLNSFIKGIDHSLDDKLYEDMMREQDYESWLKVKEKQDEKKELYDKNKAALEEKLSKKNAVPDVKDLLPAEDLTSGKKGVVQGKDITSTWERRSDKFNFVIDDVVDAQGFNGLPKVVPDEEFEKAVKESNIIMQRGYRADDRETLDAYREQLYNGDWYIDCAVGDAVHGKGMYAMYNEGTKVSENTKETAKFYAGNGNTLGYVETMTLDPSAKTITEAEAYDLARDIPKIKDELYSRAVDNCLSDYKITDAEKNYYKVRVFNAEQDFSKTMEAGTFYAGLSQDEKAELDKRIDTFVEKRDAINKDLSDLNSLDNGTVAALKGYDAILVGNGEAVILNRTKLIIKEART